MYLYSEKKQKQRIFLSAVTLVLNYLGLGIFSQNLVFEGMEKCISMFSKRWR